MQSDEAVLFFSAGKDSLALLDLISPKFKRVLCVFMYFVPDLEHIGRYLNWAKAKYPNIEIEQVPHWNLSYILRGGVYCAPNPAIKLIKLKDVADAVRKKHSIEYVFYGTKKADSLNRRLMLGTYTDAINKGNVFPLQDWSNKEVLAYLQQNRLPVPVRYSKNASGGVGFNIDCFLWLRENYPQDLQKILKTFPLSEKILIDYERSHKRVG